MKWLDAVPWRWRLVVVIFFLGLVVLYGSMLMEATQ